MSSQVVLVVKNPPADAGDSRDTGSIPVSGRSPGRGNGTPLQDSSYDPQSKKCDGFKYITIREPHTSQHQQVMGTTISNTQGIPGNQQVETQPKRRQRV